MSDLTYLEKRTLEQFLGMASGYVLDFSNRSFGEFVLDCCGCDIFDARYNHGSGSKAKGMNWSSIADSMTTRRNGQFCLREFYATICRHLIYNPPRRRAQRKIARVEVFLRECAILTAVR